MTVVLVNSRDEGQFQSTANILAMNQLILKIKFKLYRLLVSLGLANEGFYLTRLDGIKWPYFSHTWGMGDIILGYYDQAEVAFIKNYFVDEKDTFLDIGANFGFYSVLVSAISDGKATVVAFEPVSRIFEVMQQVIRKNNCSNIHLYQAALSNIDGESTITINVDQMAVNTLDSVVAQTIKNSKAEIVKTVRLDTYVKENKVGRICLAKLDVEGYERAVLEGFGDLLADTSLNFPILMEVNESYSKPLAQICSDESQPLFLLRSLNYQFYEITEDGYLMEIDVEKHVTGIKNILCAPEGYFETHRLKPFVIG